MQGPAGELLPGDRVLGLDHEWITIDEVVTTERFSKVYNLRVEIDHTYFVGSTSWNFAVWVHNDYSYGPFVNKTADVFEVLKDAAGNVVKTKVCTLTELDVNGVKKYVYKSEVNKDVNGNFYEEVFDTPEAALAKFETEAAKASAGSASAGVKNGPVVDGGAPGKILKEGMDTGNAGAAGKGAPNSVNISDRNLQKVFGKHGGDFGLSGNWNPSRAAEVRQAITSHLDSQSVQRIAGTYRGQKVIHVVDPSTGLNVILDEAGNFIRGWKLGADQLQSVLNGGRLF